MIFVIFHKSAPLSGPQDAGHAAGATGRRGASYQGLAPN